MQRLRKSPHCLPLSEGAEIAESLLAQRPATTIRIMLRLRIRKSLF
jgi:hypothetical protein